MTLSELLQLSGGYWSTCALHAGVKLEVFTHLDEAVMTAPELARIINVEQRGLEMLLNALTAMELLEKKGNGFSATGYPSFCRTDGGTLRSFRPDCFCRGRYPRRSHRLRL